MKIKTVIHDNPGMFDAQVNELLAEGYMLGERSIIKAGPAGLEQTYHYAQLVLLDPVPEPEQGDPVEALRCIRDFCEAMPKEKCLTPECPLSNWCYIFTEDGVSPAQWTIPGEEADR